MDTILIRRKEPYKAFRFDRCLTNYDELKSWLWKEYEIEVFKIEEDNESLIYNAIMFYKNKNFEVSSVEFGDGWFLYVDEFDIINSISENFISYEFEKVD